MKRSVNLDLKFEDAVDTIKTFLFPVFEALVQEKEFFGNWSSELGKWIT